MRAIEAVPAIMSHQKRIRSSLLSSVMSKDADRARIFWLISSNIGAAHSFFRLTPYPVVTCDIVNSRQS